MTGLLKAAAALFSAFFAILAPEAPKPNVKDMEGKPLPKFEMTSVEGKRVSNQSLKGKAAVIDFWASWCGPCKKASPVMQEIHKEFSKQGLLVIGADGLEDKAGPDIAKAYAKEHSYTYLFTHTNDKLMDSWGINGVPTIIFVDKSGKVTKVQIGYGDALKPELMKLAKSLVRS